MREPDWRPETAHGGTPMWGILIIANVLCFILQYTVNGFYSNLALYPALLKEGHVYQLLTFQFLHGDLFHIIINCLMIWMMGKPIEEALGKGVCSPFTCFRVWLVDCFNAAWLGVTLIQPVASWALLRVYSG